MGRIGDDALRLTPPSELSLEQSMEFIKDDELLEVTPKSLRLRKTVLSKEARMKQQHKKGLMQPGTFPSMRKAYFFDILFMDIINGHIHAEENGLRISLFDERAV